MYFNEYSQLKHKLELPVQIINSASIIDGRLRKRANNIYHEGTIDKTLYKQSLHIQMAALSRQWRRRRFERKFKFDLPSSRISLGG